MLLVRMQDKEKRAGKDRESSPMNMVTAAAISEASGAEKCEQRTPACT
jgi:hypothetical protein